MSTEFQSYEPGKSRYEIAEAREISTLVKEALNTQAKRGIRLKAERELLLLKTKYEKAKAQFPDGEGAEMFTRLLEKVEEGVPPQSLEEKKRDVPARRIPTAKRKPEAPKIVTPKKENPVVAPKAPKFDDVKAGSSSITVEPPESSRVATGVVRGKENQKGTPTTSGEKLNKVPVVPEEKPVEVAGTQESPTNDNEGDEEKETKDIFAGSSRVIDEVMGWLKSRFH